MGRGTAMDIQAMQVTPEVERATAGWGRGRQGVGLGHRDGAQDTAMGSETAWMEWATVGRRRERHYWERGQRGWGGDTATGIGNGRDGGGDTGGVLRGLGVGGDLEGAPQGGGGVLEFGDVWGGMGQGTVWIGVGPPGWAGGAIRGGGDRRGGGGGSGTGRGQRDSSGCSGTRDGTRDGTRRLGTRAGTPGHASSCHVTGSALSTAPLRDQRSHFRQDGGAHGSVGRQRWERGRGGRRRGG